MTRKLTGLNLSALGFGAGFTWENVDENEGSLEFSDIEAEILSLLLLPRAELFLFPRTKTDEESIQISWKINQGREEITRKDEAYYLAFQKLFHHDLIEHKSGLLYELSYPGRVIAEKIQAQQEDETRENS